MFGWVKTLFRGGGGGSLENPSTPLNSTTLGNPARWLYTSFGAATGAGVTVSYRNAYGLSAVYRAVGTLSENIASIQQNVLQESEAGDKLNNRSHAVARLLRNPHPLYTSFDFFQTVMIQLLLSAGKSYSIIERDAGFRPLRLRLLEDPDSVRMYISNNQLFYRVPGEEDLIPDYNMLHFKGVSFDGLDAEHPVRLAKEIFGLGLSNQEFKGRLYTNGSHLGGYLKHPGPMSDQAYDRLRKSWHERHGGTVNAGGTAILEEGAEYIPLGLSAKDGEYIATAKFIIEEIGRFYNIPPHMLHHLERMTNNNVEQLDRNFIKYSIRPWCKKIEEELTRKLIPESEKDFTKVHYNLNSLLRGNAEERSQLYQVMYNTGAISANEIRRNEDMNSIENGDKYYRPLNMHPIDEPLPATSGNK